MNSFAGSAADAADFMSVIAEGGTARRSFVLEAGGPVQDFGLPRVIQFTTLFVPRQRGRIAGFNPEMEGDIPGILLFVLPPSREMAMRLAERDPQGTWLRIYRILEENIGIIIHEITHMLDNFRGKEFMKGKLPPYARDMDKPQAEFYKSYINNPLEFNAMFQQGMFDLRQHIEFMGPPERWRTFKDFRSFKRAADETMGIALLRGAIEGKWEKKLETRLWQTWQHWKAGEE
jgi:hypothetical protein